MVVSRFRRLLAAVAVSVLAVLGLASCAGPDFGAFTDELKFGDETVSDEMVVDRMTIPDGGLGSLIGQDEIDWWTTQKHPVPGSAGFGQVNYAPNEAEELMRTTPSAQCTALSHTVQEESSSQGEWALVSLDDGGQACEKTRSLSWLEKTLWSMYQTQSEATIEWLSTDRNTLVASEAGMQVLKSNASPMYSPWFKAVQPYLNVAQGVLVVFAAVSLIVLAGRLVWNLRDANADTHLLGKFGWILVGCLLGSSCASIALSFFTTSSTATDGTTTPALESWTPGKGTGFYVSDWIRMQVDPFMLVAVVVGVLAAGFKLITTQEGRDLVPLGKAFTWAIATSVLLAGGVNLFQNTVDTWTSGVLDAASGLMNDAWEANSLAASQFFELGAPIALLLSFIVWIGGVVAKVFTYLRAGLLPILVGVAPLWAAMSWTEQGRQAFAKTMGWLIAFLAYKPVAALVLAAGSAIMASGSGDSEVITLVMTLSVILVLPALVKLIVPTVQMSVGGGGGVLPAMLGMGAGAVVSGAAHGAGAAGRGLLQGARKAFGGEGDAPKGAAGGVKAAVNAAGAAGAATGPASAGNVPSGSSQSPGRTGSVSAGASPGGAPEGAGGDTGVLPSTPAPTGADGVPSPAAPSAVSASPVPSGPGSTPSGFGSTSAGGAKGAAPAPAARVMQQSSDDGAPDGADRHAAVRRHGKRF